MKHTIADVLTLIFLFLAAALFVMLIYTNYVWGDVNFLQILINLEDGVADLSPAMIMNYIFSILFAVFLMFACSFIFSKNRDLCFISVIFLAFVCYKIDLYGYLKNQYTYSLVYENEYVYPQNLRYDFPSQKRNLVLIYLESMEEGYQKAGSENENLIPNISSYMQNHLSFDGFYQLKNQGFTIAAMVESLCAVPYQKSSFNRRSGYQNFLPQIICMPEILKNNGYNTSFLQASNINFARTGLFLKTHGFSNVYGKDNLKQYFLFKENKGAFNGFRDSILYKQAQTELQKLADHKEPFFFFFFSLDTRAPDFYLDASCQGQKENLKDVVACADQMLNSFLEWMKTQKFYENTTVVVLGNHLKIGKNALLKAFEERKIVNFILNPSPIFKKEKHQKYTMLDMAPTMLNAIGVNFDDKGFGLGRSLLRNIPTLIESEGLKLEAELMKSSKIYQKFEEPKTVSSPQYYPYTVLNKKISEVSDLQCYASYSQTFFDMVFLNEISLSLPKDISKDLILEISFKMLLKKSLKQDIKVYANGHLIDVWHVLAEDKQPLEKSVRIEKKLIDNNKLLLNFEPAEDVLDPPYEGIGVLSVLLKESIS